MTASFAGRDPRDLIDRKTAAALLGLSPRSLDRYAVTGGGPSFCRLGSGPRAPVRYTVGDLIAWVEAGRRQSTTGDAGARGTVAP